MLRPLNVIGADHYVGEHLVSNQGPFGCDELAD
jgi:hypothetical protein